MTRSIRPSRRLSTRAIGRRRIALLVTSLALLIAAGMCPPAASAVAVPYTDPSAVGAIGLCNKAGQPVTGGNIHDRPFVWRAVSSVKAPGGLDVADGVATLLAYQPRPNTAADQWNGDTLTATSYYTNIANPMAQATDQDFTLADFMGEFKPMVNGLLQLRMYMAAPGRGTLNSKYPATNIVVNGDSWSVVNPVSVPCTKGDARSSELDPGIAPLPGSTGTTAAPTKSSAVTASPATAPATPASASASASSAAPSASTGSAASATHKAVNASSDSAGGSSNAGLWIVGLIVLVAAGAGGFWYLRRMRGSAA